MLQNQNGTKNYLEKLSEKLCSDNRKTIKCALQDNPKKSNISVVSGDQGRNTQGSSPLWEKEDQLVELQSSIPRHCNGRRWGGFLWLCRGDKKSDRAAEATARSRSTLNWIQLRLGCAPLRNPHTVRREARGRNGSVVVVLRPAPRGVGVNGPPMIRKMLPVIGIRDCLVRVKGDTRRGVNVARAVNSAIRQLL